MTPNHRENRNGGPVRRSGPPNVRRTITVTQRALFLWIMGTLFLLVWGFTLGVFVGRGTGPANRTIGAIEEKLGITPTPQAPPIVEMDDKDPAGESAPEPAPDLTFYKTLSDPQPSPERGLPQPDYLERKIESLRPSAPPEEPAGAKQGTTPAERAQLKVTSGVKTVDPTVSKSPPPQLQPGQNFTIQVAASSRVEDANRSVSKLKEAGFDAYFYEVEVKGRRYFRVRVGRYATRDEAKTVRDRLVALGYAGVFVSALVE